MSGVVPDEFAQAHKVRRILREAGDRMIAHGVLPVDVGFGAFCAALDTAEVFAGPGLPAIEWLRNCCDAMEQSVLQGLSRVPK